VAAPQESPALTAADPRIYVEINEDNSSGDTSTLFVLRNHGGDVAHSVTVEPLQLLSGSASFPIVDHIAAHENREVLPDLGNEVGIFQRDDIRQIMLREWDQAGRGSGTVEPEFSRKMRVTYTTYSKKQIETTFDLVFLPIKFIVRKNHNELHGDRKKPYYTLEIRNIEITPVSQ